MAIQRWRFSNSKAYTIPTMLPCCLQRVLAWSTWTCIFQIFLIVKGEKELISQKLKWSERNSDKRQRTLIQPFPLRPADLSPTATMTPGPAPETVDIYINILVSQRQRVSIISILWTLQLNSFDDQLFIRIALKLSTQCNIYVWSLSQ